MILSNISTKVWEEIRIFSHQFTIFSDDFTKKVKNVALKILGLLEKLFEWMQSDLFQMGKKPASFLAVKISKAETPEVHTASSDRFFSEHTKNTFRKVFRTGQFIVAALGAGFLLYKVVSPNMGAIRQNFLPPNIKECVEEVSNKDPHQRIASYSFDKKCLSKLKNTPKYSKFLEQWSSLKGSKPASFLRAKLTTPKNGAENFVSMKILGLDLKDIPRSKEGCEGFVTKTYRPLSRIIHPDKNPRQVLATENFRKLADAYKYLKSEPKGLCSQI